MSTGRVRARARVQVTLEILVPGGWSSADSVGFIRDQATEMAIDKIRNGLGINFLKGAMAEGYPATIVGTPKVSMIIVEDE